MRINILDKRGFQISFAWLFAIIVGGIILFLAIYAVVKISSTQEIAIDAQTSKQIGVLLNPLETGFETAQTTSMILPAETRIFNRFSSQGYFGRQIIKVSQKSFGGWTDTDIDVGFSNKYIFSEEFVEGKKFYLFSKPFKLPFKVADVIYITSADKKYCFTGDIPRDTEEEIENLNQGNLFLEGEGECPKDSIEVCFNGNCDIEVSIESDYSGYVEKRNNRSYFEGDALMYAAIFSDLNIYEGQLKRLMQRGSQLSQLYVEKAGFEGCFSNVDSKLFLLADLENKFKSSGQSLSRIVSLAKDIGKINDAAYCKLW